MSVEIDSNSIKEFHCHSTVEILAELNAGDQGLNDAEARSRLEKFGPNSLPAVKRRGPALRFLQQFHNVLIYVLLVAAGVTALLSHWVDTSVIVGVVLINAIIGFIQEGKAEKAMDALHRMLSPEATVLREGKRAVIAAEALVPGDIVLLQAGDKVPADLRLLSVKNLRIEEATLTGESSAVEKTTEVVETKTVLGERYCMAYSSTLVVNGQGVGVVVATAEHTEIGRINTLMGEVQTLTTPLLRQMEVFGRWLTVWILVLAAVAFLFGWLVHHFDMGDMFIAAVSMAVAAIPEGLPAVMTITLALGVQRMAKRNAIIRRLPAVESLGSVTVICTDKTGTLTRNEMTVQRIITADQSFDVSGSGYSPHGGFSVEGKEVSVVANQTVQQLARVGLLCNEASLHSESNAWHITGDPTEGSLITLALKAGLEAAFENESLPRTDLIPFEAEHRFMATLHHDHAGHGFIFVKGAAEQVLAMCAQQRGTGNDTAIDLESWQRKMSGLGATGQRVLGFALRDVEAGKRELSFEDMREGFIFLGVVGISDPLREEAIAAVRDCQAAGIRVKMITGDHAETARAIASKLGIGEGGVLSGSDLDAMDEAALRLVVRETDVFARASPQHKLRLVAALQANGEIVAMTGDGVNDAPALKRADIGVAMGMKGTEVAKEAAELVLADDDFATIAHAVAEGRAVYDNLKKAIVFIMPTNGGEAAMVLVAILFGMTLPITPVQILWVNMVSAVTLGMALSFEKMESGVMRRPPRNSTEPILSGFMLWRIVFVSALLTAGPFVLFLWESARGVSVEESRTVAVNALVMGEICYLFNCRYLLAPTFSREGFFGNRIVLLSIAVLLLLQLAFTYLPAMQHMFSTVAIDAAAWLSIIGFGLMLFIAVELEKFWIRRKIH